VSYWLARHLPRTIELGYLTLCSSTPHAKLPHFGQLFIGVHSHP